MKSKLMILLLCLTVIIASSGCTTAPSQTTAASDTTGETMADTTAEVTTATSQETTTITFWHNYDAGAGQVDVLKKLIAEFEAANPDVKVEQLYLEWSALKDNVVTGASTGSLPDVLRGDIAFVPQFQALNVLVKMSDFDDYTSTAAKLMAAPNSTNKMGDDYYGIAANTNTKILFYNKDIMDKKGVDAPSSLAELWQVARDLSGEGVIGMVEPWTGIWNVGPYIWSNGGDVLAPDYSTADGYINSQIAVDTIQTLADLYRDKALAGPSMDPGAVGDTDGWAAGIYGLQLDGPWRANANNEAGTNYGAMPLPAGSAGSISVLGGEDFMMFKSSDDAKQAASWKFIQFMVGKDAQIEMAKVGQMPVNEEALASDDVKAAMPLIDTFATALQTAKSRPVTAKWGEMENIIATKVAEAITGLKDVKTALDEAAQDIDALIQQ